jgi:surface carbohydrate biosynthesis protein
MVLPLGQASLLDNCVLPQIGKSHNRQTIMNVTPRFSNCIILPSENQTREFDGKLLLAAVLAEKGFDVFIGARHEIHNHIGRLPRSIYVAKDFRKPSERIFSIIESLGHYIVAWDEEGLVQPRPELYYSRRYTKEAISHVREVFAWGTANEKLMLGAPHWPDIPIHRTGNPRIDLLRPELRGFHEEAVAAIKSTHGRFVLFDSNFASFNPAVKTVAPVMGSQPEAQSTYIENRQRLFERWKKLLPKVAKAIAPAHLIIRPHPAEDHAIWLALAQDADNMDVIHEGSALPWILAADIMLHSGCTTGIEAYVLARPCISFQPYDILLDLPDTLSVVAKSESQLLERVIAMMADGHSHFSNDHQSTIKNALFALKGPMAADRIADVLQQIAERARGFDKRQLAGVVRAEIRYMQKRLSGLLPGHKTSKAVNRLRYPGVSLQQVRTKVGYLKTTTNRFSNLHVEEVGEQIFCISTNRH